MATTLSEKKIKTVVQKTVRAELMRFFAALLPHVSIKEQREIETKYGKPSRAGTGKGIYA